MEDVALEAVTLQPSLEDLVNTLSQLNAMRLNGESHDCTLRTEDGASFPVHRIVLISSSDYFRAMFTSTLNEGDRSNILVPGVKGESLSRVIDFAYAQPLEVSGSEIWDLILTADMLLYKPLVNKCFEHLTTNMTPLSSLQLYQHTKRYNVNEFRNAVKTYLIENFNNIPNNSDELMSISPDTLADILQDDRLTLREDALWQIVKNWLENSPEERGVHAADLLKHLRLAYLDPEFIFKHIMCHPTVTSNQSCRGVIAQLHALMWRLAEMFANSSVEVDTPYIARPRLPRDLLFVIGGNDGELQKTVGVVQVYDSKADLWCQINKDSEIQEAKRECHACVFLDNCIYVLGGEEKGSSRLHNTVSCWDLVKKKWYCIPPMKQQRCKFCAVVLSGTIVVIGGWQSNFRTLATVEQYHPRYNTWTFMESMRSNRCAAAATVLDRKIYVCGGSSNRLDNLKTVEVYDCEAYAWGPVQHMNETRKGAAATNFKGRVIVAGGRKQPSIERYDPITDTWTRIGQMMEPRHFFTLTVLDNVLFAIGGTSGEEPPENLYGADAYDEDTNTWRPVTGSEKQLTHWSACVAHDLPNADHYLCHNRDNLLEVKRKLVESHKQRGELGKAKDALRILS